MSNIALLFLSREQSTTTLSRWLLERAPSQDQRCAESIYIDNFRCVPESSRSRSRDGVPTPMHILSRVSHHHHRSNGHNRGLVILERLPRPACAIDCFS